MAGVYRISRKKPSGFLGNLSVTLILILINVVLFILFSILISSEIIPLDFVAIQPANILSGKYLWTFLTSMFMHGGFFDFSIYSLICFLFFS
jgi:membrane associated rhomboid family serine protease